MRQWRVVWLLPVVWLVLAYLRVRHAPLFAVAALVGIADFFPVSRVAASLVRRESDLYVPQPAGEPEPSVGESARAFAIPAGLVLVALLLQAMGAAIPVVGRGWARLDPTIWPVELLPELKEHQFDRPLAPASSAVRIRRVPDLPLPGTACISTTAVSYLATRS